MRRLFSSTSSCSVYSVSHTIGGHTWSSSQARCPPLLPQTVPIPRGEKYHLHFAAMLEALRVCYRTCTRNETWLPILTACVSAPHAKRPATVPQSVLDKRCGLLSQVCVDLVSALLPPAPDCVFVLRVGHVCSSPLIPHHTKHPKLWSDPCPSEYGLPPPSTNSIGGVWTTQARRHVCRLNCLRCQSVF